MYIGASRRDGLPYAREEAGIAAAGGHCSVRGGSGIGRRATEEVPGVSGTRGGGRIAEVVESVPRGCGGKLGRAVAAATCELRVRYSPPTRHILRHCCHRQALDILVGEG